MKLLYVCEKFLWFEFYSRSVSQTIKNYDSVLWRVKIPKNFPVTQKYWMREADYSMAKNSESKNRGIFVGILSSLVLACGSLGIGVVIGLYAIGNFF